MPSMRNMPSMRKISSIKKKKKIKKVLSNNSLNSSIDQDFYNTEQPPFLLDNSILYDTKC